MAAPVVFSDSKEEKPRRRLRRSKAPTLAALVLAMGVALRARKWIGFAPVSVVLPRLPEVFKRVSLDVPFEKFFDAPGPESLVVSALTGAVYTGLGDGRVVKKLVNSNSFETVFRTCEAVKNCPLNCAQSPWDATGREASCGRPLGLRLLRHEKTLLVADAYFGLLKYDVVEKKLRVLASNFTLLNDIALSLDERFVFASETSTKHQRRRIFYAALEMRANGRVWRIDVQNGHKDIVADALFMPNGLEVIDEKTLLIVCGLTVYSLDLNTRALEVFIEPLPGTGDNVRLSKTLPDGEAADLGPYLFFGLGSPYAKPFSLLKFADQRPKLRTFLVGILPYRLLIDLIPKATLLAVYDLQGTLIALYHDDTHHLKAPWISEAHATDDGYLYFGSWYNNFLLRINQADLQKTEKTSSS